MALYLPQHNALFTHIPRTGGTWLRRALTVSGVTTEDWLRSKTLEGITRKHQAITHIKSTSLATPLPFTFAFVRHPVSYYASVWRRMQRDQIIKGWDHKSEKGWEPWSRVSKLFDPNEPFEEWASKILKQEPAWVTRLFEYYIGPEGGEFCKFVGRLENLKTDFGKLGDTLGFKPNWENVNSINCSKRATRKSLVDRVYWRKLPQLRRAIESSEISVIRRWYS